ncbi:probable endo-1,4-beta-xylanase C [Aspergillus udagawae]|uniref:Tryprostatin B 6-hydroxylase n=1 Tax=Aspergillus udagawae TaxID=91492 RepID=A0A8H3S9V2_9EURO|nr:probable endo-1,4-beta-xylanase C [Aspergillus udagawae]
MAPYILIAIAGILSHVLYFRHGEHHVYSRIYLVLLVVSTTIATVFSHYSYMLVYLASLYTSILVYRLLLHPLHSFPGPLLARVSSLWFIFPNRKAHLTLQNLHSQYGPIVRTGPSDLSILYPSAVPAIYGSQSPCTKSTWYDSTYPSRPLQHCRDIKEHNARRRTWSPAFSDKMVRGYEQRIKTYQQQLIAQLTTLQTVDVRKWIYLYSFDVMGDLSFGRGFDCLTTGREHPAITLLNATMNQVGLFFPPWLHLILLRIPGVARDWWRFLAFCSERLQARMRMDVQIPDISASLLAPLKGREPTAAEKLNLDGDARLIVVAGSDTTAVTLCAILYELVRHPEEMRRLREEVEPFVDDVGEVRGADVTLLEHLNGVINEALRMYPAVPGALWRKTPAEGIWVEGVHIPGEMTVYCPQYAMGRSELCYARPDEFIPERWYKYPDLIKDRSAFAPFTLGPYNCIGRPVALLNLRTTLVKLITTFDVGFAPGEDGRAFVQQAQDNFVLYMGPLHLTFTRRR